MNRMTPNEFLQTGLLEEYAMGLLSEQRASEVADYIAVHPSVRAAYNELQESIEELAESHAIKPPSGVKAAMMDALSASSQPSSPSSTHKSNYLTWALAAMIGAFSIYAMIMWKTTVLELEEQKSQFAQLKHDCEMDRKESSAARTLIAFNQNPNTKNVLLKGNEKANEFGMVARCNSSRNLLSLDVLSSANISADQVLCLWGDKNGEMILIAKIDETSKEALIKYDSDMESLNVTIENKNSKMDHPNVSQLIASVAIS